MEFRSSRQGREQRPGISVVAEALALVDEQIAIAGSEDEAGPELEGIFPEAVLAVARRPGTCSCFSIVAAEQMKQVPRF